MQIFSKLVVPKLLIRYRRMHNLSAIFVKILDICKQFGNELVDARGNIPRPGSKPRFSDLEVTALNLTMESLGIDSESFFFALLQGYREEIPNLISRLSSMTEENSVTTYVPPSEKGLPMTLMEGKNISALIPCRL